MASILTKATSRGASQPRQLYPRCLKSFSCLLNRSDQGVDICYEKNVWRALIEVGFIIFLFYSNLLMGEFERSGMGQKRGVAWAIGDAFTAANFEIATIAALIGYIVFEFLRKRF
jgi:hypothetical protein